MSGSKSVPTLEFPKLDEFHFGDIPRQFPRQHHLFHIGRLEETVSKISFPLPPHRKPVYDLILITRGESVRSKGLNEYRFSENEIFFLPALQITAHESMSEDIAGFFLHFSSDLFGETLSLLEPFPFLHFNTNPVVRIPAPALAPIVQLLERLLDLYENNDPPPSRLIVSYLVTLFTEVHQHVRQASPVSKNAAALLTQQYKSALTQHIYNLHSVKEYAQILHVTPNHLNKCVKKTLNKTAQTVLNEMLVLEAKSLLKYSNLTIAEIAEKLCRSTPSNFSRFFKRATGISPKQYAHR